MTTRTAIPAAIASPSPRTTNATGWYGRAPGVRGARAGTRVGHAPAGPPEDASPVPVPAGDALAAHTGTARAGSRAPAASCQLVTTTAVTAPITATQRSSRTTFPSPVPP